MENSNVTDATFFRNLRIIEEAEAQKDKAVAKLRTARKTAKDDGIVLADLDAVRRLAKLAPNEIAEMHNNGVRYSRLLNVPFYSQMEMFDPEEGDVDILEKAAADGELAGKLGRGLNANPHDEDTEAGQAWMKGYYAGEEQAKEGMKA